MKTKSMLLQVVLIVAVASAAAAFQERRDPARASKNSATFENPTHDFPR